LARPDDDEDVNIKLEPNDFNELNMTVPDSIGECQDRYEECLDRCKECQDRYEECRGRNGWKITAIIFIILFLLTIGAVATIVVLIALQLDKIRPFYG
jgi:hypothetical protein